MIELSLGASGLVVNTTRVKLEGRVRSINSYGDRCLGDGAEERALRSRRNIVEARESGTNVGTVESAGVRSSSSVRIRSFGINTSVLDNVLESLIHETTIASLVSLGGG